MATPPRLDDLLARFLTESPAFVAASDSEVELLDAVPAQAIDAGAAWSAATEALATLNAKVEKVARPRDWSNWVASRPPMAVVFFCAGSYPQAVRDVNSLLKPLSYSSPESPSIAADASSDTASSIMQVGLLRETGRLDEAEVLLAKLGSAEGWQTCLENERAALLMARGRHEEAEAIWAKLPDLAPVCFNRGVAALIAG